MSATTGGKSGVVWKPSHLALLILSYLTISAVPSMAFSSKEIYNIPNSGWLQKTSWNWGSASGTGHDCAAICRRSYATRKARSELVGNLLKPADQLKSRVPENFEEVKLVLALAWQNGRWDGSDGGPGGYGEVLAAMADANRYEVGSDDDCSRRLVQDMQDRFALLEPSDEEMKGMESLWDVTEPDVDKARRTCCGLVLNAMGFIENGN
jgi:hypothetical protein